MDTVLDDIAVDCHVDFPHVCESLGSDLCRSGEIAMIGGAEQVLHLFTINLARVVFDEPSYPHRLVGDPSEPIFRQTELPE